MPQDPVILLGFINLKLRDFYGDLDDLCEDLDVSREEIVGSLASIGYHYDDKQNQFV